MDKKLKHILKALFFTILNLLFFIYVFPLIISILVPNIKSNDFLPVAIWASAIFTLFFLKFYPTDK